MSSSILSTLTAVHCTRAKPASSPRLDRCLNGMEWEAELWKYCNGTQRIRLYSRTGMKSSWRLVCTYENTHPQLPCSSVCMSIISHALMHGVPQQVILQYSNTVLQQADSCFTGTVVYLLGSKQRLSLNLSSISDCKQAKCYRTDPL